MIVEAPPDAGPIAGVRRHRRRAFAAWRQGLVALGLLGLLVLPVRAQEATPPSAAPDATLDEQVVFIDKSLPIGSVRLETTIFRPPGEGPFPLALINHGKADGDPRLQGRARYLVAARALVARGFAVALPMRQGFSKSTGQYVGSGCNPEGNGAAQAEDVRAALDWLVKQSWVDRERMLVIGQSHGGLTTLAFAGLRYPGVRAVVNVAGGLRQPQCAAWESNLVRAVGRFGERAAGLPSLWFYGANDSYWSPDVYRAMHAAWTAAGGHAELVEFGPWPHGDAHAMFSQRAGLAVWLPRVEALAVSVGIPVARPSAH